MGEGFVKNRTCTVFRFKREYGKKDRVGFLKVLIRDCTLTVVPMPDTFTPEKLVT